MLYCSNCGSELQENQQVCLNCGKLVVENKPTEKDTSMTFAIIGVVGGLLIPLIGFISGGIGLSRANKANNSTAKTLSILAIVIGVIMFFVYLSIL